MDLESISLPASFPDHETVRADVADYYWEVQRFDRDVGRLLAELDRRGERENTLVVVTGDHGMPFPRCKGNLYDCGVRVPMAIGWPERVAGGRVVDDFISLTDLAPTFLEAAGIELPREMTGRSLLSLLRSEKSGRIDLERNQVLFGKERHVPCQEAPDSGGTPMRALRTREFLYVLNFRPERWPAGTPNFENAYYPGSWYGDVDNGPTKSYMVEYRSQDDRHQRLFRLAFGRRPAEELYDLSADPGQLDNVAGQSRFSGMQSQLRENLMKMLKSSGDPRALGRGDEFDQYPYFGGSPLAPGYGSEREGSR